MHNGSSYHGSSGMDFSYRKIMSPEELGREIPVSSSSRKTISDSRKTVENILSGYDGRKLIITGPCSIHNADEALEYGEKLKELQKKVSEEFYLVMRTYFEKPRSSGGWKGLISDPDLDGGCDCEKGIYKARYLLSKLTSREVPLGTEFLSLNTPDYIEDFVSWAAIGARTSESQPHREMASYLEIPVGIKNNTNGEISSAINGVKTARKSHTFIKNTSGGIIEVSSKGNPYCHMILRGGKNKTNYSPEDINEALDKLGENNLPENLIIDCSHGNSHKNPENQPNVFYEVMNQVSQGKENIRGVMLESNLEEGKQKEPKNSEDVEGLEKGVSITDACLSWKETEELILNAYRNNKSFKPSISGSYREPQ